jgi:RimJ/RimL family protein N-acetyltransferase
MQFELSDGTRVHIRRIRPDDKVALAAGHGALSDESRRLRYLAPKPRLSAAELRYLTEVDEHDHIALVAVLEGRIVGVARAVRLPDRPDTAEFAIVVGDALQGRGLGGRLALAVADLARAEGIARLTAFVLPGNVAAQRLVERIAGRLESARPIGGMNELSVDLAA